MNKTKILLALTVIPVLALFSYKATFSFFSNQANSTSNIFAAASTFPTPTPTPTPTPIPGIANHVVISEVQITGGTGATGHDFIELYNPTSTNFDLNGHKLVKRSGTTATDTQIKSWTTSTIISSHGFYLWASNSDSSFPASITADTSTSLTLATENSIALRQGALDTGTIIDSLSWNSASQSLKEGTEFSPDPSANQSMERKAYSTSTATSMNGGADDTKGNGYDIDNNATDFVLRIVSQPQNSSSATEIP